MLEQAARVAVLELEMEGAVFTEPRVGYGVILSDDEGWGELPRFPLHGRNGDRDL